MALPVPGLRAVRAALDSDLRVRRLLVARGPEAKGAVVAILRSAEDRGIRVEAVERSDLDRVAGGSGHQGIVALVEPPEPADLQEVLDTLERDGTRPFLLALDGIQDPQNLGAILRAADGAGVHAVIVPERGAAQLSPGVVRASAGAALFVPLIGVPNLAQALRSLSKSGIRIVGASPGQKKSHSAEDLGGALVLVIGGESDGLRESVRDQCDRLVTIPMRGRTASLNAAAAAAVLLFEAVRQRGTSRGTDPPRG